MLSSRSPQMLNSNNSFTTTTSTSTSLAQWKRLDYKVLTPRKRDWLRLFRAVEANDLQLLRNLLDTERIDPHRSLSLIQLTLVRSFLPPTFVQQLDRRELLHPNEQWKIFDVACLTGKQTIVEEFLNRGMFVTSESVARAAAGGHLELLKELIKRDPEQIGNAWLFCDAAHAGHLGLLRELFQQKLPYPVIAKKFVLQGAAAGGQMEVLRWIISQGALSETDEFSSSQAMDWDWQALYFSIKGSNLEAVRLLLENGAKVPETVPKVARPIVLATKMRNLDMVSYLLSTQTHTQDELTFALDCALEQVIFPAATDIALLLLEHNTKATPVALADACCKWEEDEWELVISRFGEKLRLTTDMRGNTALHSIFSVGRWSEVVEAVERLLVAGWDISARTLHPHSFDVDNHRKSSVSSRRRTGKTPLIAALQELEEQEQSDGTLFDLQSAFDCFRVLIERGCPFPRPEELTSRQAKLLEMALQDLPYDGTELQSEDEESSDQFIPPSSVTKVVMKEEEGGKEEEEEEEEGGGGDTVRLSPPSLTTLCLRFINTNRERVNDSQMEKLPKELLERIIEPWVTGVSS